MCRLPGLPDVPVSLLNGLPAIPTVTRRPGRPLLSLLPDFSAFQFHRPAAHGLRARASSAALAPATMPSCRPSWPTGLRQCDRGTGRGRWGSTPMGWTHLPAGELTREPSGGMRRPHMPAGLPPRVDPPGDPGPATHRLTTLTSSGLTRRAWLSREPCIHPHRAAVRGTTPGAQGKPGQRRHRGGGLREPVADPEQCGQHSRPQRPIRPEAAVSPLEPGEQPLASHREHPTRDAGLRTLSQRGQGQQTRIVTLTRTQNGQLAVRIPSCALVNHAESAGRAGQVDPFPTRRRYGRATLAGIARTRD